MSHTLEFSTSVSLPDQKVEERKHEKGSFNYEEVVAKVVERVYRPRDINVGYVASSFNMPLENVRVEDVEYFRQYTVLAGTALVRAVVRYDEAKTFTQRVLARYRLQTYANRKRIRLHHHDVVHTVVSLIKAQDKTAVSSLHPEFVKDSRANYRDSDVLMEEEAFSTFWEPFPMVIGKKNKPRLIARMTLLSLIKQAEGDFEKFYIASLEYALQRFTANYVRRDDFLKVIVRRQDPVLRSFLKRLFDEYAENPRFFFEVFHDATRPIMSRAYPSR